MGKSDGKGERGLEKRRNQQHVERKNNERERDGQGKRVCVRDKWQKKIVMAKREKFTIGESDGIGDKGTITRERAR
jgi:hypothetical protein